MVKSKRVFIIDDDMIFHFILKKLLFKNNKDTEVYFFQNGYDAIEKLKEDLVSHIKFPDLILLDVNMPIMDGWQFLEEFKTLKNISDKKPVIYLLSASDDIIDVNKSNAYQDVIKSYLLKSAILENVDNIFN